jgi:tRNA A-37 threonylcarbamoyl transferase component Bud32
VTTVNAHLISDSRAADLPVEPGTRLHLMMPDWRSRLDSAGLRHYGDFLECSAGEIVATTGTSQTRRIVLAHGDSSQVAFLKQYRYSGARWRHRFRRHKGEVEARNYRLMRDLAGVPVPDVVAVGSRRAGLRLLDAFILTRGIVAASPLDDWWTVRTSREGVPPGLRRAIIGEVLDLVVRMHRVGFYHVDLQWRNILIRETSDGPRLFVLDSSRGGLRRTPWMRWHARMRDLSSLEKTARNFLSRTERVRFVHAYLRATRCRETPRKLITRILADRRRKDSGG